MAILFNDNNRWVSVLRLEKLFMWKVVTKEKSRFDRDLNVPIKRKTFRAAQKTEPLRGFNIPPRPKFEELLHNKCSDIN